MGKKIILLYHRVNHTEDDYNRITVEEKNFYAHMYYLSKNYKVLALEELISYRGEKDVMAITFDDGFADFYEKALPILTEFQIPATVFVTTGKLNTREELWTTEILRILFANRAGGEEIRVGVCGRHIVLPVFSMEQRTDTYRVLRHILMQISEKERGEILSSFREQLKMDKRGREEYRLMSFAEIQKIAANPLVTIGAHTVNHISMGRMDGSELLCEIQESIKILNSISKKQIQYFAYPFGGKDDYSDKAVEILHRNGIKAAFTVEGRCYEENKDSVYKIPRLCVGNWTAEQFKQKIEEWITEGNGEGGKEEPNKGIYIGKIENDLKLWGTKRKIIIWGTGVRGKRVYSLLHKWKQADRIIAFGDNNPQMWDQVIDDIPIWRIEKIREQKDVDIILYNVHDVELLKQFVGMEFINIHWLM